MASVTVIKSVLLVVMIIITAVAILLPSFIMRFPRIKNSNVNRRNFILSIFNCFGGGVFIATGFIHLLPDAKGKTDDAFHEVQHKGVTYPFTQFVVCVGFLFVLIIENIAMWCRPVDYQGMDQLASLSNSNVALNIHKESTSAVANGDTKKDTNDPSRHLLRNNSGATESPEDGDVTIVTKRSSFHAFTMALALSVHSVFEGLALGLEEETDEAVQVFAAIIIHKTIIAFSMGINFVTVNMAMKSNIVLTVIFSLASPIGGAVGIALAVSNSHSPTITMLNAILLALATGTFFYIAFIEVVGYELSHVNPAYHKYRLLLILGIVLGFALFAGASFIQD